MRPADEAGDAELQDATAGDRVRGVDDLIRGANGLEMLYQPIVALESGSIVGYEALARFSIPPPRPPNVWFDEARKVGRGVELELVAVERALAVPPASVAGIHLSINLSPPTLAAPQLGRLLANRLPPTAIVVELTEHETVADYPALISALAQLRSQGIRVAVDDAGAGYASMRHILDLSPDLIKLDRSLIDHIDTDPARRALSAALAGFAHEIGAEVCAEGIERDAERRVLTDIGISFGQGYLLGRPAPWPAHPSTRTEGDRR